MPNSSYRPESGRALRFQRLEDRRVLAAAMEGAEYELSYSNEAEVPYELSVSIPSILGDLDRDGEVNVADLLIVNRNVGANNLQPTDGDFNGDGRINAKDWAVVFENWTADTGVSIPSAMGDLDGDGEVNATDLLFMHRNVGTGGLQPADGDFSGDGRINAVDWAVVFENWTGKTNVEDHVAVKTEVFYWPEFTPEGHSRMLKLNPFLNDNVKIDELGTWLEDNGWTHEEPNAVLLTMGSWLELQATELYKGENGVVTIESIAYHVRNGMKNWERAKDWWEGYLHEINNLGYEVNLVAMDIEAGLSTTGTKYSPPNGPEITMLEVINYLYSSERWARDLPEVDLDALNEQNIFGVPKNEQAMLAWNHWSAKKNVEAWTEVFAETTTAIYPDAIVNNFNYSTYGSVPLLDRNVDLPRANAAVDGNSSPVLYLQDDYGYETVQDALAAFDIVRGESNQPHTIVPWIGGPYREDTEGWHVTEENFAELKYELEQRGVPYLLVF